MRRDSCLSVPTICSPPAPITASCLFCQSALTRSTSSSVGLDILSSSASKLPPRTISVPRPAILVAIVTAPGRPASATTSASRSCCFALSTLWLMPRRLSSADKSSELSIDAVPTNTGWPRSMQSTTSSTMALYFSGNVRNIRSLRSSLTIGLCVGTTTTSSP